MTVPAPTVSRQDLRHITPDVEPAEEPTRNGNLDPPSPLHRCTEFGDDQGERSRSDTGATAPGWRFITAFVRLRGYGGALGLSGHTTAAGPAGTELTTAGHDAPPPSGERSRRTPTGEPPRGEHPRTTRRPPAPPPHTGPVHAADTGGDRLASRRHRAVRGSGNPPRAGGPDAPTPRGSRRVQPGRTRRLRRLVRRGQPGPGCHPTMTTRCSPHVHPRPPQAPPDQGRAPLRSGRWRIAIQR